MTLVPHFVQNELDASDTNLANRLSAFNWCDPFDHILPFADGTISAGDRAHLWGMFAGIVVAGADAAGWPTRKRVILPDGRRLMLTLREIAVVRQQLDAERARQLAEIEAKPTRKRKKAKKRAAAVQEIEVAGERSIALPPMVSALPGYDDKGGLQAAIYQMLRSQENDALILLLMVS